MFECVSVHRQCSEILDSTRPAGGYCNFAYSALACLRMGMSGSASFQNVRTVLVSLKVANQRDISLCMSASDSKPVPVNRPTKVSNIVKLRADDEFS